MLLEFSCSNHKSIRSPAVFSMLAGKDNAFEELTEPFSGVRVLRSAVMYGANGAGKSSLIDAFSFVRNLVVHGLRHEPGEGIRQTPHKLDGFEKESSYQIQFVTRKIRYVYGFSLKNRLADEEYLYFFPNGRQTEIFERSGNRFSTGRRFRGKFSSCKGMLRPDRLMLSCAANFSSVPEVMEAFRFFRNELIVHTPATQDDLMKYSFYRMNGNQMMKAAVLTFLDQLGTGIRDIKVSIDQKKQGSPELPFFLSDEFPGGLLQGAGDTVTAKVVYDNFETDLLQEESAGVKKLISLLCPLIDVMINGKVLLCDGLESDLHESLVCGLVRFFLSAKTGKFAQLVFTSHATCLLSMDLFRRDQIWFAEMKEDERSTNLYSLTELRNVRKDENFARGYLSGRYGAVPMLNPDFADIVSQMQTEPVSGSLT